MASSAVAELRAFHEFIAVKLQEEGADVLSPEEALDLWRVENPTPQEYAASIEAIREGLEDMKAGRTRPAREFVEEMRRKSHTPESR